MNKYLTNFTFFVICFLMPMKPASGQLHRVEIQDPNLLFNNSQNPGSTFSILVSDENGVSFGEEQTSNEGKAVFDHQHKDGLRVTWAISRPTTQGCALWPSTIKGSEQICKGFQAVSLSGDNLGVNKRNEMTSYASQNEFQIVQKTAEELSKVYRKSAPIFDKTGFRWQIAYFHHLNSIISIEINRFKTRDYTESERTNAIDALNWMIRSPIAWVIDPGVPSDHRHYLAATSISLCRSFACVNHMRKWGPNWQDIPISDYKKLLNTPEDAKYFEKDMRLIYDTTISTDTAALIDEFIKSSRLSSEKKNQWIAIKENKLVDGVTLYKVDLPHNYENASVAALNSLAVILQESAPPKPNNDGSISR